MAADSLKRPDDESMARAVFQAALKEERCVELWDCLTDGGSATVDAVTRKLMVYPRSFLEQFAAAGEVDDDASGAGDHSPR
jgi:hypothetical protein